MSRDSKGDVVEFDEKTLLSTNCSNKSTKDQNTMLRQARLDFPGTLHHVIIRGIEKRQIVDDDDRARFVSRLGELVLATGARFMHLERDDDNHLFAVGFRTPPEDSTGIAHILEHTALCGSQRFPVRDPFSPCSSAV